MFKVLDSYGCLVRMFPTYLAAIDYKYIFGNSSWKIKKQL
jgi:hypothetical protein